MVNAITEKGKAERGKTVSLHLGDRERKESGEAERIGQSEEKENGALQ